MQSEFEEALLHSAASWAYADADEDGDDPAETYHEAAKFYPCYAEAQTPGLWALTTTPELRQVVSRSVRRGRQYLRIELPASQKSFASFEEAVRRRRSIRSFSGSTLRRNELAWLLRTAYGVTERFTAADGEDVALRSVPSAGALFPLELYALVARVDGLEEGLYHYDPLDDVLEAIPGGTRLADLRAAMPWPVLERALESASLAIVIAGMFWRNRFKYGQRGYRFVLLEAGHVAQNVALAASALEVGCVPVGGFYDDELDRAIGLDGLHEGSLYALLIGGLP